MTNKYRYLSIAYVSCLLLFFSNIPYTLFFKNEFLVFILSLVSEIIAIIIFYIMIKKENLKHRFLSEFKFSHLSFLPFLILCFSNFFVIFYNKWQVDFDINHYEFWFNLILCIPNVILEEFIFRYLIMYEFANHTSKIKAIFYSALIFGGVHILNISSLASIPIVLVQVVYTFGIGLVVGLLYSKSDNNLIYPMIFHMFFNIFNDILASLFILEWNKSFFIINSIIGILTFIYSIIIYKKIDCEVIVDAT